MVTFISLHSIEGSGTKLVKSSKRLSFRKCVDLALKDIEDFLQNGGQVAVSNLIYIFT